MKEIEMSKHTPGPWAYAWAGGIALVFQKGEATIASIPYDDDNEIPQVEANARLIAAVPDLLEALKGVLRVADRATVEFDAARAAIAKATGEKQ
jgi:hypothetical protein